MATLLNIILFVSAFVLGASNTIFGIDKDGGPLAKATEVSAFIFILSSLLLYLTR